MRVGKRPVTGRSTKANPRQLARTQVVQLHTRNYAVRFGLELEANAIRFFALGAQSLRWRSRQSAVP
jgi:hypothetical protein